MTEPLSKRRLKLWIRLLRVTRLAEGDLREFLRVAHQSTLPRFDVMAALHRAGEALTMSELSHQLLVSNGNTTTVVDRLEKDGMVVRTPSVSDRRIVHVAFTAAGRRHFEQQATDHEARERAVRQSVGRRPRRARRPAATNDTRTNDTRINDTRINDTTFNGTRINDKDDGA